MSLSTTRNFTIGLCVMCGHLPKIAPPVRVGNVGWDKGKGEPMKCKACDGKGYVKFRSFIKE